MKIRRLYRRSALTISPGAPIAQAAAVMRRFHVPALMVADPASSTPMGIVAERDIALQGFAAQSCSVRDAMGAAPPAVAVDADVDEALGLMREHGVIRLVVTEGGDACGMVSIDDIVEALAAELAAACALLKGGGAARRGDA